MIDKIRVKSAQVCQISTAKVNLMGIISGTTKKNMICVFYKSFILIMHCKEYDMCIP